MELHGRCKLLRVYLGEDERWKGRPLADLLLKEWMKAGMAGATVYRGIEGFGASSHIHSTRLLEVMEDLPVILELVEKPASILKALNIAEGMLPPHCLVTLQDVKVLHYRSPKGKHSRTRRL
jgi:uncharacterized protein